MDIRDILFSTFPRMYGNPFQQIIHSSQELNRLSCINSTYNDKNFCSICTFEENVPIFTDLFLENDDINMEPVRKIFLWCESHNIPCYVLFSGRGGFHIHALFLPQKLSAKIIKIFAKKLIDETETQNKFDPHVIGDIRRLCRIPNTKRNNESWCIPLTKEEILFIDSPSYYQNLSKIPRFLNYPEPKIIHNLTDFLTSADLIEPKAKQIVVSAPRVKNTALKSLLRPCVYRALQTPNPNHIFRITSTIELLNQGVSSDSIYEFFTSFDWIDFSPEITKYQIEYIVERRKQNDMMNPYNKQSLGCDNQNTCMMCILQNV